MYVVRIKHTQIYTDKETGKVGRRE